jgi:hypothetical protein
MVLGYKASPRDHSISTLGVGETMSFLRGLGKSQAYPPAIPSSIPPVSFGTAPPRPVQLSVLLPCVNLASYAVRLHFSHHPSSGGPSLYPADRPSAPKVLPTSQAKKQGRWDRRRVAGHKKVSRV